MLCQLACEELVELGVEHTVCHELRLGTKVSLQAAVGPHGLLLSSNAMQNIVLKVVVLRLSYSPCAFC